MLNQYVAFEGSRRIGFGDLLAVAQQAKVVIDRGESAPVLIFDSTTSRTIEVDFRGSLDDVTNRIQASNLAGVPAERKKPGRPKLGVVSREVTLLPRHWDWLNEQPGGASVALRRLVENARKTTSPKDRLRDAQEAVYRFMSVLAGNLPGYEDALRALYAGNETTFQELISAWPADVQDHLRTIAAPVFELFRADESNCKKTEV